MTSNSNRATRSLGLLATINRLRLAKPRDATALERAESRLFELDAVHGYDRAGWTVFKHPSHFELAKPDRRSAERKAQRADR